ncbi:hypothetical protein JD969_19650 [Planctomycetota bacterium]|nr:hypothetical protein JD969_19650 [Planctomycetota bacterium]
MLELHCPKCNQSLNIDEAFAGSVCRCSNCGTLMSIPELPASKHNTPPEDQPISRIDNPLQPSTPQPKPQTHKLSTSKKQSKLRSTIKFLTLLIFILLAIAITVYVLVYLNQNPGILTQPPK